MQFFSRVFATIAEEDDKKYTEEIEEPLEREDNNNEDGLELVEVARCNNFRNGRRSSTDDM